MPKSDHTSDNPFVAEQLPDPLDPTVPPAGSLRPPDPIPTVEQDRQVLAWLQCSTELGSEVTGYLCDTLLDWSLHSGRPYPEMALPADGPDCDHLQVLTEIIERILRRISDAETVAGKLELGRAGRLLRRAAWAAANPQAVRESIDRELLVSMPALDDRLAPSVQPGGWLR